MFKNVLNRIIYYTIENIEDADSYLNVLKLTYSQTWLIRKTW